MKYLKSLRYVAVIGLTMISAHASAAETSLPEQPTFYITPQIGNVNLSIDGEYTLSNTNLSEDNIESGIAAGIQTESNIVLEVGVLYSDSIDLFDFGDTYNFSQIQALVGYEFQPNEHFIFTPKIGFSFWDLEGEEGIFLNPGNEATSSLDGNDFIWSLDFEFPVYEHVNIHFSYANNNFEFGKAETTTFGVTFEF